MNYKTIAIKHKKVKAINYYLCSIVNLLAFQNELQNYHNKAQKSYPCRMVPYDLLKHEVFKYIFKS